MVDESVYSYHTFTLPFVWKGSKAAQSDLVHIARCFDKSSSWVDVNLRDGLTTGKTIQIQSMDEAHLFYKEYQYFSPHVRNALYGVDNSVVRVYTFMPETVRNQAHYYIEKSGTTYDLLVSAINLKIYNTGIGLFIMECENHGKDAGGNPQNTLAAVKNINEYGRRINLPLIPTAEESFSPCADKLTVEVNGIKYETDFQRFANSISDTADILQRHSMSYIARFIKEILSSGCEYQFTTDDERAAREENALLIYPALDDRMFVNCYVRDPQAANEIASKTKTGGYAFLENDKLSKSLYEFVFIDPDDNCSCMSGQMRKELLERHVYQRWLDYCSVYAIAAQSFVYLTNSSESHLLNSFLTQYMRMSSLALVQRASLMLFERELADITVESATKTSRKMKRGTIVKIMDIRERFIAYQSQLGFTEISSQEQAIELWDMLRDSFQIQKQTDAFSKRMDDLQDAANTSLSFSINVIGLVFTAFTAIGIISNLLSISPDEYGMYFWDCFGVDAKATVLGMPLKTAYIVLHIVVYLLAFLVIKLLYRRRK